MKIQDVMTPNPMCCMPEDAATRAARIMRELNVGIVPVVKSPTDRRLVGVVTDRDLCLGVVSMDQHPQTVPVQQCMTTNMIACQPGEDIQRAADLMKEHQVRRIPVINPHGILCGMVSNLSSNTTHHLLKKVTEPTAHASKPRGKIPDRAA